MAWADQTVSKETTAETFAKNLKDPVGLENARLAGAVNHYGAMKDSRMGILFGYHGLAKVGKTDSAYSVLRFHEKYPNPDFMLRTRPFFHIDTHLGSNRVRWRYREYVNKVCEAGDPDGFYFLAPFDDEAGKTPDAEKFVEIIDQSINYAIQQAKEHGGGMIVLDSVTDYQKALNILVKKDMGLGEEENLEPARYAKRNTKLREAILRLKRYSNGILIADDTEIYNDARLTPTGLYRPDWYHRINNWLDIRILLEKEGAKRYGTIQDSGYGLEASDGFPEISVSVPKTDFISVINMFKARIAASHGVELK